MRAIVRRAAFAIVLLAAGTAAAQAGPSTPRIGINVDREPLVQGEPFELTINISTESSNDPQVRLPRFTNLRVLRQSESHPLSFSFSFGMGSQNRRETKRQSIYTFVIAADRAGRYVLDPVIVTLDGQQFKSDPYVLNVVDAVGGGAGAIPPAIAPDPTAEPLPPTAPAEPPAIPALDGAAVDPDYFVQMEVSKQQVTVGEMLVLTVYLYTSWRVSDVDVTREPGTEGFWVETLLAGQRRLSMEPVQIGGKPYERGVLRKLALFPIEPGTVTIAPAVVEVEVRSGGFFSKRKTVKRAGQPVSITVAPLPAEGQPADFKAANVGRYSFQATTDTRTVKVGEPVTLTLTVRGEGNLRNLELPAITEVDGFKVYAPESEVNIRASEETVSGSRSSRVLMIPKAAGTYTLPPIEWAYFDPRAGAYRTLTGRPGNLMVQAGADGFAGDKPAEGAAGRPDGDDSFDRLNRKLRSILSRAEITSGGDAPTLTRPWFLALVIVAPLGYLGVMVAARTRRRRSENLLKGRSKRAAGLARRRLDELGQRADGLSIEQFFGELQRTLITFFEDRLEAAVAGDTMAELRARLMDRGFTAEQAERAVSEMEACEFARFARSAGSPAERRQGLERAAALVRELGAVPVTPPPDAQSTRAAQRGGER